MAGDALRRGLFVPCEGAWKNSRHAVMKRSDISASKRNSTTILPSSGRISEMDESGSSDVTRRILSVLLAYKSGDFSVRLPADWVGISGKIADAFNEIVEFNQRLSDETARVSRAVGKEGKLKQRLSVSGAKGDWDSKVVAINTLIDD